MSGKARGRRPVEEITDPQRRTLRELRRFTNRRGFPPTIQELADILGISPPSLRDQITQLVRKRYVKRESRKARGLTVLREPAEEVLELRAVPIVGRVAAGQPILAEEGSTKRWPVTLEFSRLGLITTSGMKMWNTSANRCRKLHGFSRSANGRECRSRRWARLSGIGT